MRWITVLFTLFVGICATPSEYFHVVTNMRCGTVLKEILASSQDVVYEECGLQCLQDPNCGGYTWPTSGPARCTFISHTGVLTECSESDSHNTAIRDTRIGFASLDSIDASDLYVRCPDFMVISKTVEAVIHSSEQHSPSLAKAVSESCIGQQSCHVPLDSQGFLEGFLSECATSTVCDAVRVTVECKASTFFNEDVYFNGWSSSTWPQAIADAPQKQHDWQYELASVPAYPVDQFHGRGALIVAGGKYLEPALVLAVRLRELGFSYPIEFWHMGANEIAPEAVELLTQLHVTTCDFLTRMSPELLKPIPSNVGLRRFQLKPLALLHSNLKEILLLDADNLPVRNPAYLFDTPEYRETGTMFWPDYWTTSPSSPIWTVLGLHPSQEWEQESGQLMINKAKAWRALNLCVSFNSEYFMHFLNGDKDTFRFSWKASGTPYYMIATWPATLGIGTGTIGNHSQLCGHTMLQHDPSGAPLFVHHNQMKELTLPVGQNFKYLQHRTEECRAVPKAGFSFRCKVIPCFDFQAPRMPYIESHILPVSRAHLELFELRFALALRTVRRRLSPSNLRNRRVLGSGLEDFSNVTLDTFTLPDNNTEYVTVCPNAVQAHVPATNITDRLCTLLPPMHIEYSISLSNTTNSSGVMGSNSSSSANSSTLAFVVTEVSSGVETLRPVLKLFVGFTYTFIANVNASVQLTITNTMGGGLASQPIPEAIGAPQSMYGSITFQPMAAMIGVDLWYESPLMEGLGARLDIVSANFDRLISNLRFGTVFNSAAYLFLHTGTDFGTTLHDCTRLCAESATYAHQCLGLYIWAVSQTDVQCRGLSNLGTATPTQLSGQSWMKLASL